MPGFSLWMMPPAPIADRFRTLIAQLSRRLGTPAFEPHLTLTGLEAASEAAALETVRPLARRLAPLPIRLTDIGATTAYYRCLFIHAERTSTLTLAYQSACHALGQPPGDFMPHLSLIYGALNTADKERVIADLGRRFDDRFTVERLALYTTAGPPPEWRRVAEFVLMGT